jgi:hypothetical protein
VIVLWCARLSWALLPLTVGDALSDAIDGWSRAPAVVATVLLWSVWALGLVACFAPRPWGLTALRVAAPTAVVVTFLSIPSTSAVSAAVACTSAVIAAVLVCSAPVARAAGNALAYGDETRFPLRIPTPLLVTVVPLAIALTAAGVAAGPLLIADERVIAGAIALAAGLPLAAFLARSLHALSRRWLVLVPAGAAIVDPLILIDPVLVRREDIAQVAPAARASDLPDALDLRLGSTHHSVAIRLRRPIPFGRRQGRAGGKVVSAGAVLVAPVGRRALLGAAAERRIPTGVAS